MNRTEKLLQKLDIKTRNEIEGVLLSLYANKLKGLNVKKLKGSKNLHRIRVGKYRIIYSQRGNMIELMAITLRNEKTYKDL